MPIPTSVGHADLMKALEPLCELLGTSVNNHFSIPGITVADGEITFVASAAHESDPTGRAKPVKAWGIDPSDVHEPHPQGLDDAPIVVGDGESSEFGYAVRVRIALPGENELSGGVA